MFVSQGQGNWCKETVEAKILLDAESPLLVEGLEDFLQTASAVIARDCEAVSKTRLRVFNRSGEGLVANYMASIQDEWRPVKADPSAMPVEMASSEQAGHSEPARTQDTKAAKAVKADYINLVAGVMPPAQDVLADEQAIIDYVKTKDCEAVQRAERDEFALAKLKHDARAEAEAFLRSAKPELVELTFPARLGEYDFDKSAFPFAPMPTGTSKKVGAGWSLWCPKNTTFPESIQVSIKGGEVIQHLAMAPDAAESLLKSMRGDRQVTIRATLRVVQWGQYLRKDRTPPTVTTVPCAVTVSMPKTGEAFFEYPSSWLEPRVAAWQKENEEIEREQRLRQEAERLRQEREKQAQTERIMTGTEPILATSEIVLAHFKKLSDPKTSGATTVNGVDVRRPLLLQVTPQFKENVFKVLSTTQDAVAVLNQGGASAGADIGFRSDEGRITVVVQNSRDFATVVIPADVLPGVKEGLGAARFPLAPTIQLSYVAEPVGYAQDPWKDGRLLYVHAVKCRYHIKMMDQGNGQTWEVEASSKKQPFTQKKDDRTARTLSLIGVTGGMESDKVESLVAETLKLPLKFDEHVKILASPDTTPSTQRDILALLYGGEAVVPGHRDFKGFFVQTGKSLMGFGSPVYSLRQAVLKQTAAPQEKEAILEGLVAKFGEPDLTLSERGLDVYNWGRRITDDRSGMPVGKELRRPVSALEAQVYSSETGVLTVLILTDGELYPVKANITTQTVF
ncbi:MAG: DUF4852 domain-containing protein [Pseudodesulfovibrio sp.]|uniref:DUF4852 domain-containing protein n=1 Tax=Pseudodesulfovibrio aespoeensis TaxID=182210 RepID=UPI001D5B1FDB|nr:DUF4852 domain-containing protein [Pseudomonadota bacterium]MBU4523447.1 DUF4852 domain-containing protein [Pseudomonadota bacterium]MBU4559637.1 DUF4852 domain-containing protein [Pseudomonadota bacterium]MBV1773426.1 DUF4852 domain-containing protein [Pseudodesulfovibrio sp.]